MMFKYRLLSVTSSIALVLATGTAFAQQGPGTPGNAANDPAQAAALPSQSAADATQTTTATSQNAPSASDNGSADIIVTAQKRVQTVRDVGLSINVASGDQLATLGVRSTDDLVKIAPGLTFAKSVDGTPLYTLRGVGFNDFTLGSSPTVSLYVDQVNLAFGQFARGALLDIERVEVLKGPQGILFGQNATGGAINYIANKPTKELKGGGGLSYGRFNTFDADTYVSGPISDTLAIRMAASTTQSGPWQKSSSRDAGLGRQDILRGRLIADWKPTDRLSLEFNVNGWVDHSETQAAQLIGISLLTAEPLDPASPNTPEIARRIAAIRAQPFARDNARSADWNPNRSFARDDSFYQFSLRGDYELGDVATLTSITAYSKFKERNPIDRDGTPLEIAEASTVSSVNTFSQELRLSGNTDSLNWLAGGNYGKTNVDSVSDFIIGDATNTLVIPGLPFRFSTTTVRQHISDYAGFANIEYKLSHDFAILGGARYTKTKTEFETCGSGDTNTLATFSALGGVLSGSPQPALLPGQCATFTGSNALTDGRVLNQSLVTPFEDTLNAHNFSFRAGLNYKPSRNLLVYGLISRGYKSGAYGAIPASTSSQYLPATQERLTAYEIGTKFNGFNNAVQLNLAAFHYAYKDKQIRGSFRDPVFGLLDQIVNVPKSRINGAEAELTYRPFTGLSLRGTAAYVDSKVLEFSGINNVGVAGNFAGSPLPFSPKWNIIGDISYEWALSSNLEAFVNAHALRNTVANATLGNPEILRIRPFTTVDLTAGIRGPDNKWTFSLYGRNVFNEYYWNNAYTAQDVVARLASQPGSYGASFRFNF